MATKAIQDYTNIGSIADSDKLLGERVDGTTVRITFNGVVYDADFSSNGLMTRTAAGTYANRTITGTTNYIDVTNGNGVSGNPTLTISPTYAGGTSIVSLGTVTAGTWNASVIGLTYGGSGKALTASNGGLVYTDADSMEVLAGTATAGQIPRSGSNSAPSWSTTTYPATNAINTIMYASSANVLGSIAAANSSLLGTDGSGVPSFITNIPTAITIGGSYIYRAGGTDVPITDGGTGVSAVTTSPTASAFAGWDANANLSANIFLAGHTSTATAAGTTTLTVASTQQQVFTGSTTQNCDMPVVSTLALGTLFSITNLSSGVVTVRSSGGNTIQALAANTTIRLHSNATSGTGASVWTVTIHTAAASDITGSGSMVRATSPSFTTPALGTPSSGTLTNCTGYPVPIIRPTGRLTLASTTPVMTSDQAAKTTIYYTPYAGNTVPIYDGSTFTNTSYTELSVATSDNTKNPAAIGASKVNDWFVWNDSGTMRIGHGPDWTDDSTRSAGTALTLVNGIYLNNASITNGPAASRGTYVGTTRSNSSSQLDWIFGSKAADGGMASHYVWNAYNRVSIGGCCKDSTDSHAYTSGTIRGWNSATTMRMNYVCGLSEEIIDIHAQVLFESSSNGISLSTGLGHDSTTAYSGTGSFLNQATASVGIRFACSPPKLVMFPTIGAHYVQLLESGGTGGVFYGDGGTSDNSLQCGLHYILRM